MPMAKTIHDSETPAHGQQVITVCAFIYHEFDGVRKVFLPKRAATKKFLPGLYELPGGHVDFGEDLIVGLKREVMEELGMTIKVGDPFAAFTYQNLVKGSHTVEVIYFATFIEPIDQISINLEDHESYQWFSEEEVKARPARLIPTQHVTQLTNEDPEYQAVLKGFELLEVSSLLLSN
jgi:8-oxo-dGTP pyrophosphatase MutT (NUDIX family)